MHTDLSPQSYKAKTFNVDALLTVTVALSGMVRSLSNLSQSDKSETHYRLKSVLQGIDFISESIDLESGGISAGLIHVMFERLKLDLNLKMHTGNVDFRAEREIIQNLIDIFEKNA